MKNVGEVIFQCRQCYVEYRVEPLPKYPIPALLQYLAMPIEPT